MMWLVWIVAGFTTGACAETVRLTADARVQFEGVQDASCRMIRHRLKEKSKAHAGLHALMKRMEQRPSRTELRRLESVLGRAGYFPKWLFEPAVRVLASWPVPPVWTRILSQPGDVAVEWRFQGFIWRDAKGIMPDEVHTRWTGEAVELTTDLSPVQLCYGSGAMSLTITSGNENLALSTNLVWE